MSRRWLAVLGASAGMIAVSGLPVRAVGASLFRERADYFVSRADAPAVLDVDRDNSPDLLIAFAVLDPSPDSVRILLNDHEGRFESAGGIRTPPGPGGMAVGDLNEDGLDDLVVTCISDSVQVFLANPLGGFTGRTYGVTGDPYDVRIAEVTGDGHPDLMVRVRRGVAILWNDGAGQFVYVGSDALQNLNTHGDASGLALLNLNGDGIPDLAMSIGNSYNLNVFMSGPGGTYVRQFVEIGAFQADVAAADMDRDGDDDLVLAMVNSVVWILPNLGDGTLGPPLSVAIPNSIRRLAVGDLQGDGWPDVVGTSYPETFVLTNSHGALSLAESLPSGQVVSLQLFDLDQNGYPDLIECQFFRDSVFVRLNANGPVTPVLLESATYEVLDGGVRLEWVLGASCPAATARVERRDGPDGAWRALDGPIETRSNRVVYTDRGATPGMVVRYRLATECGPLGEMEVLWGVGDNRASLAVSPNPSIGRCHVEFAVPSGERGVLELWDVQGRRRESLDVGAGPGVRSALLGGPGLAPGIYLVRLTYGARSLSRQISIVE